MKIKMLIISILIIFLNGCIAKKKIIVDYQAVMIDGKINKTEWADSKTINIQDKYDLFIKQDKEYYYIAIKSKLKIPFYIDMFLLMNHNLYNIHSSSQKGERLLTEKKWDDRTPVTNWGYTNDWTSNTVLFDRKKMKKLRTEGYKGNVSLESVIPFDGFEYQFLKKKWALNESKIRIEMRNMVGVEDFIETFFPVGSNRFDNEKWLELSFE